MSRRAGETPLAALLPGSIRDDATIAAAAASLDPIRRVLAGGIPNILLWARLDPTPGYLSPPLQRLVNLGGGLKPLIEAELELLAWQLHVDFRETAATPAQLAALARPHPSRPRWPCAAIPASRWRKAAKATSGPPTSSAFPASPAWTIWRAS